MKKFLILIPFLIWSIKPLNQTRKDVEFKDSLQFSIETDTMLLNYVYNELVKELKEEELKSIQKQRVKLSTVLKRRKRELERERLLLSKSKEDLKKYQE